MIGWIRRELCRHILHREYAGRHRSNAAFHTPEKTNALPPFATSG
jgi:hypothetical protein